ncbi:MAG: gamma-glutamyltransferase family protein, partial [Actinobacteria bacterium]|nr:gamma-glutamyltransferase family protein [Actinomycetota bacterium]
LTREQVLAPGIELARTGLDLTEAQAYCHHILRNILVRRDASKQIFAPSGPMLGEGEHFAQPGLARTLEALAADGARTFYEGDIAAEIVEDPDALWEVGVSVFERYQGPYTDELRPMVETTLRNRVAVKVDVERVRSWDHRKLGMGPMGPPGGTTAGGGRGASSGRSIARTAAETSRSRCAVEAAAPDGSAPSRLNSVKSARGA